MKKRLIDKLDDIRAHPSGRTFILADARDADMAWGIPSPGTVWPPTKASPAYRTMPQFHEQIRAIVRQGIVDIMLASVATMSLLAHEERLFDASDVTPAIRANDTSDIWLQRGATYRATPAIPFASATIKEAQFGSLIAPRQGAPLVNLGLYSVTFNNVPEADRAVLSAFRDFRIAAQRRQFAYFLEVFPPNAPAGLAPDVIPAFVNDSVVRMLAGVPRSGRPAFLKVPYFGPGPLEELAAYDPSIIVGVMGGAAGTTLDSFHMLADVQKYGGRAALFGRRIKDAEDPLAFIQLMRHIVDGAITPEEAVRAYHDALQQQHIPSRRPLADDLLPGPG